MRTRLSKCSLAEPERVWLCETKGNGTSTERLWVLTLYIHMVRGFQLVTRNHWRMSNLVPWMSRGRSMYFCTTHLPSLWTGLETSSRMGSRRSTHIIPEVMRVKTASRTSQNWTHLGPKNVSLSEMIHIKDCTISMFADSQMCPVH